MGRLVLYHPVNTDGNSRDIHSEEKIVLVQDRVRVAGFDISGVKLSGSANLLAVFLPFRKDWVLETLRGSAVSTFHLPLRLL
jgi:hypothetical protein